jgi:hypothetical protein
MLHEYTVYVTRAKKGAAELFWPAALSLGTLHSHQNFQEDVQISTPAGPSVQETLYLCGF